MISDIKENIGTLMRYGMRTNLSWIPGHANIAGNEIVDQPSDLVDNRSWEQIVGGIYAK
jgi:ribonuclease HI